MSPTTEEAKTKYLKNEISAFESRLTSVKSDIDSLRKQKEKLVSEIEEMKARHNKDVEDKYMAVRSASALVDQERQKFESDKKEFEEILIKFKQEKSGFEREKQTVQDMKVDAQKTIDRVGTFIRLVRDEASKL